MVLLSYFFFFQAEDGIRDDLVTGVQTCALPISEPVTLTREIANSRFDDAEGQRVEPDDLPVERALREVRVIESQLWYVRPNRERVLISVTASPFFNEQGALAGAVALIRDVTEQQRVREQTQQADKLRA